MKTDQLVISTIADVLASQVVMTSTSMVSITQYNKLLQLEMVSATCVSSVSLLRSDENADIYIYQLIH